MINKKDFTIKFGLALKKEREKKSISQSELARICLKDRQYISMLEQGKLNPTFYTVYLICNELNIQIGSLLPDS